MGKPAQAAEVVTTPDRRGRNTARRQQVIDAAAATFSRLGYHGASTRAIADVLGIKVASLYFHITSKEEALQEICAVGVRRSRSYLAHALKTAQDMPTRLRLFFDQQREDFVDHADYVSVAVLEGRYLPKEARQPYGDLSAQFRTELDKTFAEAAGRGELHPAITPRQARFIMVATMRSISELFVSGNISEFEEVRSAYVETMIRGLVSDSHRGA